ncbi:MAG: hypothetical protein H0U76_25400 [Ktedonobacteraceae bacterium]|nr:hypothetical protein [Ktedonobacteraceae bacterium]MBA3823726.1 hypothetical protein [Ktedonobacterales bacterium]
MATPQPQPQPQQPLFAADLNTFLERHFVRVTSYFDDRFRGNDARMDGILAQMKLDRQDSQARDDALATQIRNGFAEAFTRIGTLETTMKTVIDLQREMLNAIQSIQQEVRAGFTNLDEKVNEITMRVVKLEGGLPPNEPTP